MLNVVGFATAAPQLMSNLIQQHYSPWDMLCVWLFRGMETHVEGMAKSTSGVLRSGRQVRLVHVRDWQEGVAPAVGRKSCDRAR